jgi:hypothetical protein
VSESADNTVTRGARGQAYHVTSLTALSSFLAGPSSQPGPAAQSSMFMQTFFNIGFISDCAMTFLFIKVACFNMSGNMENIEKYR